MLKISSTNKTENLGLNQWIGTDYPERVDFCSDNLIVDNAISEHTADSVAHVTDSERWAWNHPVSIVTYTGNGSTTRSLQINCGFTLTFGIVFPMTHTLTNTDFNNAAHSNYFGFFSVQGSTVGLNWEKPNLTVTQSSVPITSAEYRNYNEKGVVYLVVCFR